MSRSDRRTGAESGPGNKVEQCAEGLDGSKDVGSQRGVHRREYVGSDKLGWLLYCADLVELAGVQGPRQVASQKGAMKEALRYACMPEGVTRQGSRSYGPGNGNGREGRNLGRGMRGDRDAQGSDRRRATPDCRDAESRRAVLRCKDAW